MPFVLPNPTSPTNGQLGDATPILGNFTAIAQAIAAFDGSQINAKSVTETALADAVNPRLRGLETFANFVYTGCTWSIVSGLQGTMTGGTIYVNGYRTVVSGVGSNTFAASDDTYVDIDYLGNVTYNAVSNGSTAPAITANAIRVAKIVTNGSAITTITQTNADGVGNLIYPSGPTSTTRMQIPVKFTAYLNSAQNLASGGNTNTKILFDKVEFDTGNNFDAITNHRFTAPVAGFYHIDASIQVTVGATTDTFDISLYKGGSEFRRGQMGPGGAGSITLNQYTLSTIVQLAANDYLEIYGFNSVNATRALTTGSAFTYFQGFLMSAT